MSKYYRDKNGVRRLRGDAEKHAAQVNAANRARYKAVQLLISLHRAEFDRIYAEQCQLEEPRVVPMRSRVTTADQLRLKIAELEEQLAEVRSGATR